MKTYSYCPCCGSPLVDKHTEGRIRQVCSACDFIFYRNPVPAAGVVLIEDSEVLLVKRKYEPNEGGWTLPAGFVEMEEDVETCAVREMKEETNLDVELTGFFRICSAFDDPRVSVVLVLFLARRTGPREDLACGDDASDARFFHIDEIPSNIAFQAHRDALEQVKQYISANLSR